MRILIATAMCMVAACSSASDDGRGAVEWICACEYESAGFGVAGPSTSEAAARSCAAADPTESIAVEVCDGSGCDCTCVDTDTECMP